MTITTALKSLSTHRELVPAYLHRRTGRWIVAGLSRTHGGAVVVDDEGQIVGAYASKRAALSAIDTN